MNDLYCSDRQAGYKWNVFMTGKEKYKIIGNYKNTTLIKQLLKQCKGLRLYWDCMAKAKLVTKELGGKVAIGKTYVWSGDFKSQYGFEYEPPYEFHAWCEVKGFIIDIALPGVIQMGLELHDHIGPYITNRKPIIYAGSKIPKFLIYQAYEYL